VEGERGGGEVREALGRGVVRRGVEVGWGSRGWQNEGRSREVNGGVGGRRGKKRGGEWGKQGGEGGGREGGA